MTPVVRLILGAQILEPPSTWSVSPVIQRAASDAEEQDVADVVGLGYALQSLHAERVVAARRRRKFDMSV